MRKRLLLLPLFVFFFLTSALGQQKIKDNTLPGAALPGKDALLELESTNKGLLHARVQLVSTRDAAPLSQHRAGMMIYNTATANDVVPGIYYNNGARWVLVEGGDVTALTYDPVTYELRYLDEQGDPQVINLEKVVKAVETVTALQYDRATGHSRTPPWTEPWSPSTQTPPPSPTTAGEATPSPTTTGRPSPWT